MEYKDEIILVGNGPSILERELGSLIDSFGHVVRYNEACPLLRKNFIPNTGMKTHIHCININTLHDLRRDFEIYLSAPELKTILFEPFHTHSPRSGPVQFFNPRNDDYWAKWKREFLDPHVNVECMFYSDWRGLCSPDGKNPSMGLVSIFHYLNWYDRVFIIGFDSALDGILKSEKDMRYKGLTESVRPYYHNWENESLILGNLIKQGMVEVLGEG